jgi:hypothetical protein
MQRLSEVGSCSGNAFILDPIATMDMWDGVQCAHSKMLSCSFMLTTSSKRVNVPIELREMMEEIMECWPLTLALHLKIAAWHEDMLQLGQSPRLALGDYTCATTGLRDWIRRASSRYLWFARSCNHWCASTRDCHSGSGG